MQTFGGGRLVVALVAALAILFSESAGAQAWTGSASLGMVVKGSNGRPLPGALVTIAFRDIGFGDGPPPRSTTEEGEVGFSGLAEGRWSLKIDHPEYLSYMATLAVRSGKRSQVLSEFLEATGEGRLTMRIRLAKGPTEDLGAIVETPDRTARDDAPPVDELPTDAVPLTTSAPSPELESAAAAAVAASAATGEPDDDQHDIAPQSPTPPVPPADEADDSVGPEEALAATRVTGSAEDPDSQLPAKPETASTLAATEPRTRRASEPGGETTESLHGEESKPGAAAAVATVAASALAPEETGPDSGDSPSPGESREEAIQRPETASSQEDDREVLSPEEPSASPVSAPLEAEQAAQTVEVETATSEAQDPTPSEIREEPLSADSTLTEDAPDREEGARAELPPPARLTSFQARSCPECRPGEWATSVSLRLETLSPNPCEVTPEDLGDSLRSIAESQGALLRYYWGRFPEESLELPASLAELVRDHSCRLVAAVLPPGSRYSGFRLEAEDPKGSGDCQADRTCPIGEARWLFAPRAVETVDTVLVFSVFRNTAVTTERTARMTIIFTPSSEWLNGT